MTVTLRHTNKKTGVVTETEYVTVPERVKMLHEDHQGYEIDLFLETNIVSEDADQVTVKASLVCKRGRFQGYARSSKTAFGIEGQSPLEVAETSAVGRALGFAGYGSVDSIASAEEVILAGEKTNGHLVKQAEAAGAKRVETAKGPTCSLCGNAMVIKTGSTSRKTGLPWRGYFCPDRDCKAEPIWLRAGDAENLPAGGDVPSEDAEGPRPASWSGFWARAHELGLDNTEAHALFGQKPEPKALLHYAVKRADEAGVTLATVIKAMQGELGGLIAKAIEARIADA